MRSTVNWAVLGLLIEKPSYGYEVAQRFERRFGRFLQVGTSRIYAALNSLQRELLIEPMPVAAPALFPQRQPKVHYRATREGARSYRGWLGGEMRDDPERAELLCRLLASGAPDMAAMLEIVDRYEHECLEEARRMSPPYRAGGLTGPDAAESLMERLIVEERRIALQGQLMWIEYARKEIRALAKTAKPRTEGQG